MNLFTFNNLGLLLDIIGVILVWKFGVPNNIRPEGESFLLIGKGNKKEIQKTKIYKIWQTIGLILIILGFVFQFVGNIIKK